MIENIKALAADIDMTLTFKGADLPQVTKDAFHILHEHGVLIGLATGREMDQRLMKQAKTWNMPEPFDFLIGMNGGQVWDRFHEGIWSIDLIDREKLKELIEYMMPLIDEYQISLNAEGGGNHNAMNIQGELLESSRRHGFMFEDKTGDVDGFCEKPAYKLLFRTTPEIEPLVRKRVMEKFSDIYQVVGTFPGTVEVLEKGITKGTGLKRFAAQNAIDLKDIITFGDNENDNPMLEASGWGVCLADGQPLTKAIADDITEYKCLEGGVGRYLFDHYIIPKGWK